MVLTPSPGSTAGESRVVPVVGRAVPVVDVPGQLVDHVDDTGYRPGERDHDLGEAAPVEMTGERHDAGPYRDVQLCRVDPQRAEHALGDRGAHLRVRPGVHADQI